jgi:glutamate carboxypeptidase
MVTEALVNDFQLLTGQNSRTRDLEDVNQMQALVQEMLADCALDWERIQKPDTGDFLIARSQKMDPNKPVVILSGHVDTVLPARVFKRDGDIVSASGVNDMKGGILSMIEITRLLNEEGNLQNVILALSPEEELATPNYRGTIADLASEGDVVMVFEANEAGNPEEYQPGNFDLVSARKGAIVYTIDIKGPGGHSGQIQEKEERHSTALVAAQAILDIEDLANYDLGTTLNPGLIQAGEAVNILASHAEITGEARFWTETEKERVLKSLMSLVDQIMANPNFQAKFHLKGQFPPLEATKQTERFVEQVRKVAQELGIDVNVHKRSSSSEANFFREGNPEIAILDGFGVWGKDEHRETETADLRSLKDSIKFGKAIIQELINTNK